MKRNKIKELLRADDSVLVFDVDGVLAVCEFGEYTHFAFTDDEWDRLCESGFSPYNEEKVSPRMQKFLEGKDKSRMYVITASGSSNEGEDKVIFVNSFYGIPRENVYYVDRKRNKLEVLKMIKAKYPNLDDHKLIMIDDTCSVLNEIMRNSNFSTAHISSFLDI